MLMTFQQANGMHGNHLLNHQINVIKFSKINVAPLLLCMLCSIVATTAHAESDEEATKKRQADRRELLRELDRDSQILKERSLDLEHALYKLELDHTMHPLNEARLFFTVATKKNYTIQQLRIELNGDVLVENSYHPTEAQALRKNGSERVFHGNLPAGEHNLKAYVEGYFKEGGQILAYETAASFTLAKRHGLSHVLLALHDKKRTWEPELELKTWQ